MRFIVDAQLPPVLARMLSDHGHTAEHVADIGMRDADDSPIWDYALDHGAIIVTKDEDFPHRQAKARRPARSSSGCDLATPAARHCSNGSSRCCPRSNPSSIKATA